MAEPKFKYNIAHLYSLMPRSVDVIEALKKVGITERTFHRDKSIELKDKADIPGFRLIIYRSFFEKHLGRGVTLDELFNLKSKPSKVKTGLKIIAMLLISITLKGCVSYDGLSKSCPAYSSTKEPILKGASAPLRADRLFLF